MGWSQTLAALGVGLAVGLASGVVAWRVEPATQQAWRERADRAAWPLLCIGLVLLAIPRLADLSQPFATDALTQRVFTATGSLPELLVGRYDDPRHPPLLYLLLHVLQYFGHGEALMRLPAVIGSLVACAVLFWIARPVSGTAAALAGMAILGTQVPFLEYSREVGDLTLFAGLVPVSTLLLVRYLEQPSRGRAVAFVVAEVAMCFAAYLAVVVVLAQGLVVLARRGRDRDLARIGLVLGILLAPYSSRLFLLVRQDLGLRRLAGEYPQHLWGDQSFTELIGGATSLLAPTPLAAVALLGSAAVGLWVLRKEPIGQIFGVLLALVAVVMAVAVGLVRLKPTYLLFLLPPLLYLAAAGLVGRDRSALAVGLGAGVLAFLVATTGIAFVQRTPDAMQEGRTYYRDLGRDIRDRRGFRPVVAEPDSLVTMLLYYAFEDPFALQRACVRHLPWGDRCELGPDRLITLNAMTDLHEGWERESVGRLLELQAAEPLLFVHTTRFANPLLADHLAAHCTQEAQYDEGHLVLYACPQRPPDR